MDRNLRLPAGITKIFMPVSDLVKIAELEKKWQTIRLKTPYQDKLTFRKLDGPKNEAIFTRGKIDITLKSNE